MSNFVNLIQEVLKKDKDPQIITESLVGLGIGLLNFGIKSTEGYKNGTGTILEYYKTEEIPDGS